MPIGEILEKAFKYPWKNRALWFYGFLLAIFSGLSGVSNQIDSDTIEKYSNSLKIDFYNPAVITTSFIIVILVILFAVVGIIISAWAISALIKGTIIADKGKKVDRKEIGKVGKRTVWEVIKLTVVIPFLLTLIFILLLIPLIVLFAVLPQPAGAIVGVILGVVLLLAAIPFFIYLYLIWSLAVRGLVLNNEKPIESLKNARLLIKGKGWQTFLLSLVLGLISGTSALVAMMPFLIVMIIGIGFFAAKIYVGAVITAFIALAYLIFYIIFEGYFMAFNQVGWTLWWKALKDGKVN